MLLEAKNNGERFELNCPVAMPRAAGFLWNHRMMIQMNCRGFAVAQFMQPEPAKYAYAPNLEAKTFMQPEQPYYAHHPGRFFYIKDEESGELFSAPYEPCRIKQDSFTFSVGKADLQWKIEHLGILIEMQLSLPKEDVVEIWSLRVTNTSDRKRKLSIYPYFPIGYMSWMNQSAKYRPDLGGVVGKCITPYQKVEDYFKHKDFKDLTFFLHDRNPDAFETNREVFEGEGGLHKPSSIEQEKLADGDAIYETPVAALQYRIELSANSEERFRFLFGPAFDDAEISKIRDRYFTDTNFDQAHTEYEKYINEGTGVIQIDTPDSHFNHFANHWLPRQVFYHGNVNRLSTDPQTRNYLQDNMGMSYIKPEVTRAAFIHALSQQEENGSMPDGILLSEIAELKYINQIPHTDHCIWLPVCLRAYIDETNDLSLFDEQVKEFKGTESASVFDRITKSMRWLFNERDERGLNYIAQGDWCDPMNMVGYKGKGVSGWLSIASAHALNIWSEFCAQLGKIELAEEFKNKAKTMNASVNAHLWDGNWFARGITDDGNRFGISEDQEGRIFLNPQSWALLADTADQVQQQKMIEAVESQLETPYGVMMLAPAYTGMREDVGRVTQKYPGSAENGSIYNHAAAFYVHALYTKGDADRAYRIMRQMISGPTDEDYIQRGQLPVFIPNYYRGAYHQFPRTAGRSSQLFNTGTVSWVYRSIIEGLFGLKGNNEGLRIQPQLPQDWNAASAIREFRGATFKVNIKREDVSKQKTTVDGVIVEDNCVSNIQAGNTYTVDVTLPKAGF